MSDGDSHSRYFKGKDVPLKHAEYHSPCPNCYADCTPPIGRDGTTLAFVCICGVSFTNQVGKARRHTGWLLTRGAPHVQVAIARNIAQGE